MLRRANAGQAVHLTSGQLAKGGGTSPKLTIELFTYSKRPGWRLLGCWCVRVRGRGDDGHGPSWTGSEGPAHADCSSVARVATVAVARGRSDMRDRLRQWRMVKKLNRRSASVGKGRTFTPPLDCNSAGALPISRGTAEAPRGSGPYHEDTAGRCPSPGVSALHGIDRH
ncbi:MAG: hypothetical protein QOE02_5664, partial [Rhodospirillaceae bacterium]|nr:hypothetical protein [Rhodospirillaceae bacterium]